MPPPHHGPMAAHPQVNGHMALQSQGHKGPPMTTAQKLAALNEQVWIQIGTWLVHLSLVDSFHPGLVVLTLSQVVSRS